MRGGRGLERLGMCECKFAPRFLSVIVVYKRIEGFTHYPVLALPILWNLIQVSQEKDFEDGESNDL